MCNKACIPSINYCCIKDFFIIMDGGNQWGGGGLEPPYRSQAHGAPPEPPFKNCIQIRIVGGAGLYWIKKKMYFTYWDNIIVKSKCSV
jgi:hypothetical protein